MRWHDPSGLLTIVLSGATWSEGDNVVVTDTYIRELPGSSVDFGGGGAGGGGGGEPVGSDNPEQMRMMERINEWLSRSPENIPTPPQTTPSNPPPQNPPTAGDTDDPFGGIQFGLDVGGAAADAGENVLSGGGDYWLSNRGYYSPDFRGNQYVRGYRFATRGSRVFRGAGRIFFGLQAATAAIDLYYDNSLANWERQGTRLGVGLIGFAGLPGFVFATTYFIIDETDSWDLLEWKVPIILAGPGPGF